MSLAAKICGLSTEAAVSAAVVGGAAFVGFVFYPPSPRAVTANQAARLCAAVPTGVARVGLFVDAADDTIRAVLAEAPIDILQFHGHEGPDRVADAKIRFDRPVMKTVAIAAAEDVLDATFYEEVADLLLFDAKPPRRPGALPGSSMSLRSGGCRRTRQISARHWPCGGLERGRLSNCLCSARQIRAMRWGPPSTWRSTR